MITTDVRVDTAQPPRSIGGRPGRAILIVSGVDGSESSLTALEAATEMIRGRNGHLEVVYVAHVPAYASMSAPAIAEIRRGFGHIARELNSTVRAALDDREPRWHFQRRDGSITEELLAAARELRRHHGPDVDVVMIVGASTHLVHHITGSVGVALARDAGFPVLVVPSVNTKQSLKRSRRRSIW